MKIKTAIFKEDQKVKVDGGDIIGTITEVSPIEFNKRNKAYYWITFPDVDRIKYPEAGYIKIGQRIEFDEMDRLELVQ